MSKEKLYIAYGSNINLEQMAFRCPTAEIAGKGLLNGYELQFKHHATIEKNEESKVPVLLWRLKNQDEQSLDKYEGYPKYYRKENLSLEINGKNVDAMMYIMNGNQAISMPTESYFHAIKQGYIDNGLDLDYLETALQQAMEFEESLSLSDDFQMIF